MKIVNIGSHKLEIYDSIDELPITRFHKYNKMLLVDSGIGSDLADFDNHLERAIRFCKSKPDLAISELENLRQNVYFIQTELSPRHLAFCVLIRKLDDEDCTDLSDDALKRVLEKISDLTNNDVTAQLDAVKKKIDEELNLYYPKIFDDSSVKEYYDELRRRTMAMLDQIITGENRQDEIEKITDLLLTYSKPGKFDGSDSLEIQYDKQFESMCLMLSQKLNVNPKNFTVLEYYNAFEYLQQLSKASNKKS